MNLGTITIIDYHSVTVSNTPSAPPTPTATLSYEYNCGNTTATRSDPPSGSAYSWFWQSSSSGTSTSEGLAPKNITSTETLYIRARNNSSPYTWSARSKSFPNVPVYTSGPATPIVANHANRDGAGSITISVDEVSGATGYRWYTDGGALIAGQTTATYAIPNLTTTTTYNVSAMNPGCESSGTLAVTATINPVASDENYVMTNTLLTPHQDEGTVGGLQIAQSKRSQSYQYFDGLGRPMQSVITMGSPNDKKDIVQPIAYDELGREAVKYLPYVSSQGNGWFKEDFVGREDEVDYPNSDQAKFYQGLTAPNIVIDDQPYAETIFEPSSLNRPEKQFGAGEDWYSNNKYVGMEYLTNNATAEDVIAWDISGAGEPIRHATVTDHVLAHGYYADGQLFVNVTKDEAGNSVREYTNKQGQVILKKVQFEPTQSLQLNNREHWASTYYVYDDLGNLRYVFPPELTKQLHVDDDKEPSTDIDGELDTWAFQYKYDYRKRMVEKKVPGADWVYMVYDKRDRLVLTQDGNQRTKKEWGFTKYDVLNRPVITGVYTHTDSIGREAMVNMISTTQFAEQYDETKTHGYTTDIFPTTALTVHTVTYYDNYDFRDDLIQGSGYDFKADHLSGQESLPHEKLKGLVTGTKTNILESDDYLWSVSYYDDRYRVIQSVVQNHKDSLDRITSIYDFVGKVEKTKITHSADSTSRHITRMFAYDHTGRLLKTYHQIDDEDSILLSQNNYNELGELITKELHSRNETDFTQQVDYRYNIRGWLSSINDPAINPNGLFNFQLKYNDPTTNGGDAQYNGNISQAIWKTAGNDEQSYGYSYDAMNRITEAKYYNHLRSIENNRYNETIKDGSNSGYDLNGNIKKLQRNGSLTATTYGLMDNLSYTYIGNQLTRVDDGVATQPHENGFKEITEAANEYLYDNNGSMTKDDNKGIGLITYNHLNLPAVVKKSGADSIVYTYDATGRKLKQQVYGAKPKTTDYAGEFVYENDTLRFINHEEGRVLPDASTSATHPWEYQYNLKDHLGNVRVTFSEKTTTEQYFATMEKNISQNPGEPDHDTEENAMFLNMVTSKKNSMYNHTTETGANDSYLLRGVSGEVVGPAKSMIVDAGDIVDMEVFARYNAVTTTDSDITNYLSSIIGAFNLSPSGGTVLDGSQAYNTFNSTFAGGAWLGVEDYEDVNAPGAFLNYLLFDTNFVLMDAGFQQVTSAGATGFDYLALHVAVDQPGYLYIYLSNENQKVQDVYFDDFKIVHHTNIEQSDDYYPFGLTFNSYQRENSTKNKFLYNAGAERQDALDLNIDLTKYRAYDPAIGRWFQVDPLAELPEQVAQTPYQYSWNNPIKFNDPNGDCPCLIPAIPYIVYALEALIVGTAGYIAYDAYDRSNWKAETLKIPNEGGFLSPRDPKGPNFGSTKRVALIATAIGLVARLIEKNAKFANLDPRELENKLSTMNENELQLFIDMGRNALDPHENDLTDRQYFGAINPSLLLSAYTYDIKKDIYSLKRGLTPEQQKAEDEEKEKGRQAKQMLNNFSNLEEGTYTWNGSSWVLEN